MQSLAAVDAYLKGLAALVAIVGSAIILGAAPRRRENQFLALFLALIAGNQGAETLRALAPTEMGRLLWFRVATVFAALDPFALFCFAGLSPQQNRLFQPRFVVPAGIVAGVFALGAAFMRIDASDSNTLGGAGLLFFTLVIYVIVARWSLHGLLREPAEPRWRFLFPAMAITAVPVVFRTGANFAIIDPSWSGVAPTDDAHIRLVSFVTGATLMFLAVVAALVAARRSVPSGSPLPRALIGGIAIGVFAALTVEANAFQVMMGELGHPVPGPDLVFLGRGGAAIRFFGFVGFVSVALVRHGVLGMSIPTRRRAARVLIGLALLVVGTILFDLWNTELGGTLNPLEIALLTGVLIATQSFRALIDRVAFHVYGVPLPADVVGRQEAYRQGAALALAEGRTDHSETQLARLREELSITREVATVLEQVAEASASRRLAAGQLVAGRYQLESLLGRGSAGSAFLARDQLLARQVVVKEIPIGSDGSMETALREARAAGGISHPNVLVVFDVLSRAGSSLLVTEHAEGGSLEARLDAGPVPAHEALLILEGVLEGVAAVHARGIVHRDLKPSNVLLSRDGRPRIADFGLARLAHGATRDDGPWTAAGTPLFMAPEQRKGEPVTAAADIWAFALLARRVMPRAPAALEPILEKCAQERAADRYQDAGAALAAWRDARSTPVNEQRAAHADDVAVLQSDALPAGKRSEVDARPVPAARNVLDVVSRPIPRDERVLRADVGVKIQRDSDASPPPDDPLSFS